MRDAIPINGLHHTFYLVSFRRWQLDALCIEPKANHQTAIISLFVRPDHISRPTAAPMFFALTLLCLCLFSNASFALRVNVTVDDQLGDPLTLNKIVYSPALEWNFGPTCQTCSAHLDPSQTSSGTWHDTYQVRTFEPAKSTLISLRSVFR